MAPPTPPIALKDQCSIIHDNVLYVYSPDALQTLPLKSNTQWTVEENGISVTGAACVKGGVDGDNNRPALYVVGGATNSSTTGYSGLQRYSILDKVWQTITPIVPVTQNRLHHGAAYMNASSSIVLYAGAQNGYVGPSTETFLVELYPPYRVQAYSSIAPPVIDPVVMTWSDDQALMIGGDPSNVKVFTFGPAAGWQDLGLALPSPLPNRSITQAALVTLSDDSKILEVFDLGQSPNTVSRVVLQNPGGVPATYSEIPGNPTASSTAPSPTSSSSGKRKRSVFLQNFPQYDNSFASNTTRTGFSLAQDDAGLITIVGGDHADSIVVFNGTGNSWLDVNQVLSAKPHTTSTAATTSAIRSTPTQVSASSSAPRAGSRSSDKPDGLTVLGAVLGAICGAAAILIIMLLWLRSIRRRRVQAERSRQRAEFPNDNKKASGEYGVEGQNLQPLSMAGQPMGRSPVPSAVIDGDAMTLYNGQLKLQEKPGSSGANNRPKLDSHAGNATGFGPGMFKREKGALSISRPMLPVLGDYKDRPSIELGKATPAPAATATVPVRNFSQRKTDEGWAKYFQADGGGRSNRKRETNNSRSSSSTSKGKSGFWRGAGVSEGSTRHAKIALRDSAGNALQAQTVVAGSPSLENGPAYARAKGLHVEQGMPVKISSGESMSSTKSVGQSDGGEEEEEDDDDAYEDEKIEHAYSSGIPSSVPDLAWTPVGTAWSGPPQRHLRPLSSNPSSAYPSGVFPMPTSTSNETSNTSGTKRSSIPMFPMPSSTYRPAQRENDGADIPVIQHSATNHFETTTRQLPAPARPPRPAEDVRDYFGPGPGPGKGGLSINNNLSWLNLNADPR